MRSSSGQAVSKKNTIAAFDTCWAEFTQLNDEVIDLTKLSSNLKAQKISTLQFASEAEIFQQKLRTLIAQDLLDKKPGFLSVYSYEAITAIFQIFAMHKAHIDEASDAEMDRIERDMNASAATVDQSLQALRGLPEVADSEALRGAQESYGRLLELNAEIVRLSRQNTNVKSLALSLGRKTLVSATCQESLSELQSAIDARQSRATK
jgi:hypothetical protein